MEQYVLQHHGVKGMKWGVRKTRKWATSKHQPSSYKSSTLAGIYAATGNKRVGKALARSNDKDAENWDRAKSDYKAYQKAQKEKRKQKALERVKKPLDKQKAQKAVEKGSRVAGKILSAYMTDQILFGGAGTKAVKSTVKHIGRAVVSAWVLANGGSDIRWYDNGILD